MLHHKVALMSHPCPSRSDLDHFLATALPLDQNADLFDHIEDCPACMAYLASQAGGPIDFNIPLDDAADEDYTPNHLEKIGDYHVVRQIGQGGMGVVYECVNRVLNWPVAVKVMNPHKLSTEALARLDREAEIQSRLNHPDIATVYEFHRDPHRPYIAMEVVHGQPLSHWLRPPYSAAQGRRSAGQARPGYPTTPTKWASHTATSSRPTF